MIGTQYLLGSKKLRREAVESNSFSLDTVNFVFDKWLYSWQGRDAPRDFYLNKVLFKDCSLIDMVVNQWGILQGTTVSDLLQLFRLDAKRWKVSWLELNNYHNYPVAFGLHNDQVVVGAQPICNNPRLFSPTRSYQLLSNNPMWKHTEYYCSYRQFVCRFDIAHKFTTDRHNLSCSIAYQLQQNVYNKIEVQPLVTIDNHAVIFVPRRYSIQPDFADLSHKIDTINRFSQDFIHRLGTSWLGYNKDILKACLRTTLPKFGFDPSRDKNVLREYNPQFSRCTTSLDVLRLLGEAYEYESVKDTAKMTWLSELLFNENQLLTLLKKYEQSKKRKPREEEECEALAAD
jgi:hypothetical protein